MVVTEPEDTLRHSPLDFGSAVAYAFHPEMRRLLILFVVGTILLPFGLEIFLNLSSRPLHSGLVEIVWQVIGLVVAIAGATFLFGGLVGSVFKLVTDANLLARRQ